MCSYGPTSERKQIPYAMMQRFMATIGAFIEPILALNEARTDTYLRDLALSWMKSKSADETLERLAT